MLRNAARFAAGFAGGMALWAWWAPHYNRIIVPLALPVARLDSRLGELQATVTGRSADLWGGTLPAARFPFDQLTYNVILLAALFAMNRPFFGRRNLGAAAVSAIVLFVTHVGAAAVSLVTTYALRAGEWSARHYSPLEQDGWMSVEFSYRLAGMFAIAFALWWVTRESAETGA